MTNQQQPPVVPSPGDGDDHLNDDDQVLGIDEDAGPLDPDLDDDLIDSAAADEIAATEGTIETDDGR